MSADAEPCHELRVFYLSTRSGDSGDIYKVHMQQVKLMQT